VQAAIELYQAGKVDLIYISGENDIRDYHEVDQMAKDIRSIIPDAPIMLDYNGTNTWQSLNNLGNTLGYHSSVTIASQKFHNQRAIFLGSILFHKPPIAYNATDTKDFWWSLFSFVRESLARTKEVLMLPIRISN
jgi:SanA protein